jgi:hypothetical protein
LVLYSGKVQKILDHVGCLGTLALSKHVELEEWEQGKVCLDNFRVISEISSGMQRSRRAGLTLSVSSLWENVDRLEEQYKGPCGVA